MMKGLKIVKKLGEGHFGETHLVSKNNQLYALKTFHPTANVEDYQREVTNLMQLSQPHCHPDVICYIDHFKINNKYYILSKYIDGVTMDHYIQSHAMTRYAITHFALWLCQILAWLHHKGFAHNDIGTNNIMRTPRGHYKLIDFGLSCRLTKTRFAAALGLTAQRTNNCTSKRLVNQKYISPELRSGLYLKRVNKYSQTSDVYAAGLVLIEVMQHYIMPLCFIRVVESMVKYNPETRITAQRAYDALKMC